MSVDATSDTFRLRSIALPAFGPVFLSSAASGAVLPVVALRADGLGAGLTLAALVLALPGIAQLLTSLPAGALVGRVGERRALLAAALVDLAAYVVAALAPSLWMFAAALLASGAGTVVFGLARQGLMIDAVPVRNRARAISTLGGVMRTGLFVGPACSGLVVHHYGVNGGYVVAIAFGAAALACLLVSPDVTASHESVPGGLQEPQPSVMSVLSAHRRVLSRVGPGVMAICAIREARFGVVALWGLHIGINPSQMATVFAIAGAVEMLVFYPGGWLMDRYGRHLVAVLVPLVTGCGLLLLPVSTTLEIVVLMVAVVALANGLGSGIVMTLGADFAPTTGRAQFLGGWRLCAEVGRAGGPLAVWGITAVASVAIASVSLGCVGLAGAGWLAATLHNGSPRTFKKRR